MMSSVAASVAMPPSAEPTLPADAQRTGPGAPTHPTLVAGMTLGRYRIESRLGAGGMGVVYAAHDPELHRRVALKLLHGFARGGDDERRVRLQREAQAMAQLSHPHVVTVHDVGSVGDVVFVAMELVDGGTLGDWMKARHGWPEIVDRFVAAGQGLAAAHAVGLVHRDFKPDNVLVGRDGRVRVTDFGLARHLQPDDTPWSTEGEDGTLELTRVGAVVGTPAYMSPEQLGGHPAQMASDQFSFCVAMWEALFGARPFPGRTLAQIAASIEEGPPHAPGGRVPVRIVRALRRGLHLHPTERFPTMAALLEELVAARRRRRGTWIALGAGAVVLVAGSVGTTLALATDGRATTTRAQTSASDAEAAPVVDVCAAAETSLEDVYGSQVDGKIADAFTKADAAIGTDTAGRVATALQAWAGRYRDTHRRACELTLLEHARSDVERDEQTQCLDIARDELGVLVAEFLAADAKTVARAVQAAEDLPRPERCIDPSFLEVWVPPPTEEPLASEVKRVRAELLRGRALVEDGKYTEAHAVIEAALEDAKDTGYDPVIAEAYYRLGAVLDPLGKYEQSRDAYTEAVWTARKARHASVELWGATSLVSVVGDDLGQPQEAERWARHAVAQAERLGNEGRDALAEIHSNLGALAFVRGEYELSRDHHKEALALREFVHGKRTFAAANSLHNLAGALLELGKVDEAEPLRRAAVAAAEGALGPDHPQVAAFLKGLGNVYVNRSDYRTALPYFQRAYDIRRKALGESHPEVASALADLAIVTNFDGDAESALQMHRDALKMREAAYGPRHVQVARSHASICSLLMDMERYDEAQPSCEQALEIRREVLGDDHPDVAGALDRLGSLAHKRGRFDEAIAFHQRAVEIKQRTIGDAPDLAVSLGNLASSQRRNEQYDEALRNLLDAKEVLEKAYGDKHTRLATVLDSIGEVYGSLARIDDAWTMHEQALAMREALHGPDHPSVARSLRFLARIHAHRGQDAEAAALYERALKIFEDAGGEPFITAETRFQLAKSLAASDAARATELATAARAEFEGLPDGPDAEMVAEIDAWLAAR